MTSLPNLYELKNKLSYDKDTGVFIRKTGKGAGRAAGYLSPQKGYVYIRVGAGKKMAHRLAWLYHYGVEPSGDIDHINGIKHDNRIENLRDVSKSENQRNRRLNKNSSSGEIGVYKNYNKWCAQITINGTTVSLGCYRTKHEAVLARKSASIANNYHENHGRIAE